VMDDLDIFDPEPVNVTVGGATFPILPLKVRQLAAFTRAINPVLPLILAQDFRAATMTHCDDMQAAMVIATGRGAEEIGELYPDGFLRLVRAVMEVNLDFFARRVLPAWTGANAALAEQMTAAAGATSSRGSSGADTATPTS